MDKSLLVYIALGIGFFYVVTTYVGDIQKNDKVFRNEEYDQQHKYDAYLRTDSLGQPILDVTLADPKTQVEAWNQSELHKEFLELFPDFDTMKAFVKNRVEGDILLKKLNTQINSVEDKFLSGTLDAEQAKKVLEKLK